MATSSDLEPIVLRGLAADVAELRRLAIRDRWGLALMAVGGVHLGIFLICHALFRVGDRSPAHFLPLWAVDLIATVVILERSLKRGWRGEASGLMAVMVRVWVTYFILCFTSVSVNALTGLDHEWFKISWASLATFGFATMAWLFHLGFLVPAVQMSLTGLLIARFPSEAYWIFGLSWCLALNGLGLTLERLGRPAEARGLDGRRQSVGLGQAAEVA